MENIFDKSNPFAVDHIKIETDGNILVNKRAITQPIETEIPKVSGHITITDGNTGEIIIDKDNAIHYENMSEAIALSIADRGYGFIQSMAFGNGASVTSGIGAITYFPPNIVGANAQLYNQTYSKIVNDLSPLNIAPTANYITVNHISGNVYSDVIVTCFLDFNEPTGQNAFDDASAVNSTYTFDEIGLVSYNPNGTGKLLTHVIFNPVQKSLNRTIKIIYTIRYYMA